MTINVSLSTCIASAVLTLSCLMLTPPAFAQPRVDVAKQHDGHGGSADPALVRRVHGAH